MAMTEPALEALPELTLEEKASLVNGDGMWSVAGVPRLGIGALRVTDGPNGARGVGLLGAGTRTLCVPCGSALGATWNAELLERIGGVLAEQAGSKGCHVLLAPTVNLHRSPLGGRNFECYSEDPLLSGRMAAAFVRGVQAGGVATTVKHFAGNDAEFERTTIDARIDERTLRELTLVPFELAVREGGAWGVMAAYNRLNGELCAEHRWLLTGLLRDEWGFDGFVISDWFAVRSTVGPALAGLDLEMPGPGAHLGGGRLERAVREAEVPEALLDMMVARALRLRARVGAMGSDLDGAPAETELDRPEDRALAREAAAEATVLLRNDGVLPLDPAMLGRVALIGPNAARAEIMGGGSATVRAMHLRTPLDELRARLQPAGVEVVFERGCLIDKVPPPLLAPFAVELLGGLDLEGPTVDRRTYESGRVLFFGDAAPGLPANGCSARAVTTFVPIASGQHLLHLVQAGRARVLVDGTPVLDGWRSDVPRGSELFGLGSVPLTAPVELTAGSPVEVVVEWTGRDAVVLGGFVLGLGLPDDPHMLARAVAAAADADVAVVVVGTNEDWETEGRDREELHLPGGQDELVRAVAAANTRTVVVINAGSPVAVPWADEVGAVLDVWFGGQEMAAALVDVLLGDAEPAGRLPTTFPVRMEDTPAFLDWPGEAGEARYGEGLYLGYRWYDARRVPVAFPFGHGCSYTTCTIGEPRLSERSVDPAMLAAGDSVTVELDVTNTGSRRGAEVVQVYVAPPPGPLRRPPKELRGFAKVWLDPGETATVCVELGHRAFAAWNPARSDAGVGRSGAAVLGDADRDSAPAVGWYAAPGVYRVLVATSAEAVHHEAAVTLAGPALS